MPKIYDVIVIGSGPGGLAAAIAAKKNGATNVIIIERDLELGGILLQCIHNGFGVEIFNKDMPGPSYAQHFIEEATNLKVEIMLDTMVLDISPACVVTAINKYSGYIELHGRSVVLAMGCRERTRSQILLPGTRPAGVFTAGTAQRWVNIEGYMPGNRFVVLGSGDIGMIMARRLTLEGATVERVLEIMPYLTGLTRNYVQCLLDYNIELQKSHTVKRIIGVNRVEGVETVAVDNAWNHIPGSEEIIPCDTVLLSVGLIPENELSKKAGVTLDPITGGPYVDDRFMTSVPGIFAAGNVVHVYDLVDWVTEAGFTAGKWAAYYAQNQSMHSINQIKLSNGQGVRYVVPHSINPESLIMDLIRLQLRVTEPIEKRVRIVVNDEKDTIIAKHSEPYARPGEIITMEIKQDAYDMVKQAKKLTVSLIEL
jgi:NADPH-dependent 2,4-dienoyl-CoA reductase/sulfur reductase-like enzyme